MDSKLLGFETFAKSLRVSVSENLVSVKKSRFRIRKNLVSEKNLGFGFGKFGFGKKVSVSVSKKIGIGKKSRFRFRKVWSLFRTNLVSEKSLRSGFGKFGIVKKSLGIGFGQNFGIVIQWLQAMYRTDSI